MLSEERRAADPTAHSGRGGAGMTDTAMIQQTASVLFQPWDGRRNPHPEYPTAGHSLWVL